MPKTSDLFAVVGKTAIVTGASYGLGARFAHVLAEAGANVVLAARSEDKLELVAKEIDAGNRILVQRCDIGEPADVKAMVEASWEHFGRVDVLVNNAGVVAGA